MRVIIEGVDRIGKTTIAKKIAKKHKLDYIHCIKEDPTDFDFYFQTLRKNNFIFDRHFIGEMIYPMIFDREKKLSADEFTKIMEYCKEENIVVIILYTDDHELLNKRMKKEKYKEVKFNYQIINNAFYTIGKDNPSYIKMFNVSDKNFTQEIMRYLDECNL